MSAIFAAERLARDTALRDHVRAGRVARTGPVALVETHGLGTGVPPGARGHRLGLAMPVEHTLDPLERDLLASMDQSVATADFLAAAAGSAVPEASVLDALVSLVRKGLVRPMP